MKHYNLILSALFIISATQFVSAQNTPYVGIYNQTSKTQISGQEYLNNLPTKLEISGSGQDLSVDETSLLTQESDTTITFHFILDSKEKVKVKARRISYRTNESENHDGFTNTITLSSEGKPDEKNMVIVEQWRWSADGKELSIDKTFTNLLDSNDKWETKGIYHKQ